MGIESLKRVINLPSKQSQQVFERMVKVDNEHFVNFSDYRRLRYEPYAFSKVQSMHDLEFEKIRKKVLKKLFLEKRQRKRCCSTKPFKDTPIIVNTFTIKLPLRAGTRDSI